MIPGDYKKPSRSSLLKMGTLSVASLLILAVFIGVQLFVISAWLGRPLSVFGFDEGPDQPIAFPHTVHVQDLGLNCTFCHRNVTIGAAATIPAVGLCMACHKVVGDGLAEVEKLRAFDANDRPIDWVRVHRVPDHVQFVHEPHIRFFAKEGESIAQTCAICHGDVGAMTKVRQVRSLKMGDCVDCHRDNSAPTDCTTCHY